jgi:tetratricopeptide (TPR) repeat protein
MLTATNIPTNIPTIDTQGKQDAEARSASPLNLDQLSASVHQALIQYPYYAVVNGFPPLRDPEQLSALARAIRAKISPRTGMNQEDFTRISFTKVYIARESASAEPADSEVTQYSRTHLPLPPHTDSSYAVLPHEMVIFHCVEADEAGGETLMVPVDDILQHLDDEVLARLREPVYPFGQGRYAVVSGNGRAFGGNRNASLIRYYQAQLERTLSVEAADLSAEHRSALAALDALLAQDKLCHKFHLQPGQILFMHNQKVLHGRTALSTHTHRLLYRLRLSVTSLSNDEQIAGADDVATHMTLAIELERLGRIERALHHYQQASELAAELAAEQGSDALSDALEAYGSLLLQTGQFDRAASIFRECLALDPACYQGGLALSALAKAADDETEAKAVLKQVISVNPFMFENELGQPTILRMQGIEGAAYGLLRRPSGQYRQQLRGGHFSVENLLRHQDYSSLVLNIFENNIDTLQDIPDFELMLNTIACPESREASLLAADRFVARYGHLPVINHPHQVLMTTRDRNSHRLNDIEGVTFPKTGKFWWDGETLEGTILDIFEWGFRFPLIIRKVDSHTGQSVALLEDESALRSHLSNSPADTAYYAIQFHDCSVRPGIYQKMRVFFIDGVLYPVANIFNDQWAIHSGDRYSVMSKTAWMQEEEQAFLNHPSDYLGSENMSKLQAICDLVKLDFFGIDFTKLSDNTLFIFELNAAMRHNFDHAKNFPYTAPHLKAISAAFDQMVKSRI